MVRVVIVRMKFSGFWLRELVREVGEGRREGEV